MTKELDNAISVLEQAKALIDTPYKWTQGNEAVDIYGAPCGYLNPWACRFCLVGAIGKVSFRNSGEHNSWLYKFVLSEVSRFMCSHIRLPSFNDSKRTTHKKVMAVLDETIQTLKAEAYDEQKALELDKTEYSL